MPILHELEVAIVIVPAAVASVLLRFDMIAPVDLHERHAMLHEPTRQQTRLPEARSAIAIRQLGPFARQIEHARCIGRSQQGKRLGAIIVDGPLAAGVDGAARLIQRTEQLLAIL